LATCARSMPTAAANCSAYGCRAPTQPGEAAEQDTWASRHGHKHLEQQAHMLTACLACTTCMLPGAGAGTSL
jgi:hypothetical protein